MSGRALTGRFFKLLFSVLLALMLATAGVAATFGLKWSRNLPDYRALDSLKLGAIRLSSMFFRPDETGPVSLSRYSRIQRYVRTRSVRTRRR